MIFFMNPRLCEISPMACGRNLGTGTVHLCVMFLENALGREVRKGGREDRRRERWNEGMTLETQLAAAMR